MTRAHSHKRGAALLEQVRGEFGLSKRTTRLYKKRALRGIKVAVWMMVTAVVIPVTMISLGLLLGPKGYEGLLAAPLAVLCSWALILYFGLKRKASPRTIARASTTELPGQIAELFEANYRSLPAEAHGPVEKILEHLEELAPILALAKSDSVAVRRLRKLLTEDATELIEHFRKLPKRLRGEERAGGSSPEHQLVAGLMTIESELARLHEQVASDSLHSLATKQRYLELKYGHEVTGEEAARADKSKQD